MAHLPFLKHTSPIWQVAWAHPKYGHILESCSYDGRVLIWNEQQSPPSHPGATQVAGTWTKTKEHNLHSAPGACPNVSSRDSETDAQNFIANVTSSAPHEMSAILACNSSDGKLSILTFKSTSFLLKRLLRDKSNASNNCRRQFPGCRHLHRAHYWP